MNIRKTLLATGLGSILMIGTAGFAAAAPQEFWGRGGERQEQAARAEIRRGEALERQGHFLESRGDYRRGEMLERRGQALEHHGWQMLRAAERHENFGNGWR